MTAAAELGLATAYSTYPRTYSVTPDAIRARTEAARRMMELAQTVTDAETLTCSLAVALADMAADGENLTIVTAEYVKCRDILEAARRAHTQAVDQLLEVRFTVPLSA